MRICLVRHAIADERGPAYPDDSLRPLTREGIERMGEAAAGIARLFVPALIVSSPYTRARQTADIVAAALDPAAPVVERSELATADDLALFTWTNERRVDDVAFVGHEPYLSATLALLLTGDAAGMAAPFKKGAAALLSCPQGAAPGTAALEWFVQPAGLRAIGRSLPG